MYKYRLYRVSTNGIEGEKWQETSFVGDIKVIQKINFALSKSKYHLYEIRLEYNY